jgi:hypothetical protein
MNARLALPHLTFAAACLLAAAAGCRPPGPPDEDLSPDQLAARRIDRGLHRASIPPTTTVTSARKQYRVGENIAITVRVIGPLEAEVLDPYLPIRGRLYVKRDGAVFPLNPHASAEALVWAELPADVRRERERSFAINVNQLFPMQETGWYAVWWEGRDDLGHKLRSTDIFVQVMVEVPADG